MQNTTKARNRSSKGSKTGLTAKEADVISARNQRESPFLQLPAEIRNKIYDYALSIDRVFCDNSGRYYAPYIVVDPDKPHGGRRILLGDCMGISKSCRQTYAESALTIFKNTEFGAYWPIPTSWTQPFLSMLTSEQWKSITLWWGGTWRLREVTSGCLPFEYLPGLKTLTIFVKHRPETVKACVEETARVRNMMCAAAGREINVVFDSDNY